MLKDILAMHDAGYSNLFIYEHLKRQIALSAIEDAILNRAFERETYL